VVFQTFLQLANEEPDRRQKRGVTQRSEPTPLRGLVDAPALRLTLGASRRSGGCSRRRSCPSPSCRRGRPSPPPSSYSSAGSRMSMLRSCADHTLTRRPFDKPRPPATTPTSCQGATKRSTVSLTRSEDATLRLAGLRSKGVDEHDR